MEAVAEQRRSTEMGMPMEQYVSSMEMERKKTIQEMKGNEKHLKKKR